MAHLRQSRPLSGLDFQVKVLKSFQGVRPSLGIGSHASGSNVIPRRARPGLAGLGPHTFGRKEGYSESRSFWKNAFATASCPGEVQGLHGVTRN